MILKLHIHQHKYHKSKLPFPRDILMYELIFLIQYSIHRFILLGFRKVTPMNLEGK